MSSSHNKGLTHGLQVGQSLLGSQVVLATYFFRFLLWVSAGATVCSMANSKKDVALLTAVFLLGLGALETILALLGS